MNRLIKLTILLYVLLINTHGENPMTPQILPFKPVSHQYKEPVCLLYPSIIPNSIIAETGHDKQERIAVFRFCNSKMTKNVLSRKVYQAGGNIFIAPQLSENILLVGSRPALELIDLKNGRLIQSYMPKMPVAGILDFEYFNSKLFNDKKGLCISLFTPFLKEPFKNEETDLIYCKSLIIEDIIEHKVLKRVRITNGEIVAFGDEVNIVREGLDDSWKAFDNNLDLVTHPLIPMLQKVEKAINSVSFVFSEKRKTGVSLGVDKVTNDKVLIFLLDWEKESDPVPILISDSSGRAPVKSSGKEHFSLSPSGKWLHVCFCNKKYQYANYLLYLDTNALPGKYLVFDLQYNKEFEHTTWITEPEGFVAFHEERFIFWDLAKIDFSGLK
jgi:hypothetical protein